MIGESEGEALARLSTSELRRTAAASLRRHQAWLASSACPDATGAAVTPAASALQRQRTVPRLFQEAAKTRAGFNEVVAAMAQAVPTAKLIVPPRLKSASYVLDDPTRRPWMTLPADC